jgi:hypothetical protein
MTSELSRPFGPGYGECSISVKKPKPIKKMLKYSYFEAGL